MNKQTTICSYNGILLSNKTNELLIQVTTQIDLKMIMLNERRKTKDYTEYFSIYIKFLKRQSNL